MSRCGHGEQRFPSQLCKHDCIELHGLALPRRGSARGNRLILDPCDVARAAEIARQQARARRLVTRHARPAMHCRLPRGAG